MLSVRKHGDVAADKDTSSLDFGSPLNRPETSLQGENSITLWGPGVKMQESPASILSHSLHVWRKENAQLSPAKAAEELDKLYENLPPEALELTFQDMIGRNNSPKRKVDNAVKNGKSPTKSNAVNEDAAKDIASEEKDNGPKLSIAAKIGALLSPKVVFSSSNKVQLSHEELDKLVEKRRKKSTSSDREGLYSASTTPATSFRGVSPFASPKLSPTPSFTDYMLRIDRHSFERELTRSASFLESYPDDTAGMAPVDEEASRQDRLPIISQSPSRKALVPDENDSCSSCSKANLFFVKSTCLVCGKSYCPSCKVTETEEVRGVRRCRDNCGAQLSVEDGTIDERPKARRKPSGCCLLISLGSCMRVKGVEEGVDNRS